MESLNMDTKLRSLGAVVITLVGMGLAVSPVLGGAKTSADMVKVEAKGGKIGADGAQEVTLTINIEEGWHLYANPVGNNDLTSAQTTVKITGQSKPKDVKVTYPNGKVIKDPTVGNYSIYEGKVVINAVVSRAKDDKGPLE